MNARNVLAYWSRNSPVLLPVDPFAIAAKGEVVVIRDDALANGSRTAFM